MCLLKKSRLLKRHFYRNLERNHKKLLSELKAGKISDKETDEIKKVAEKIAKSFKVMSGLKEIRNRISSVSSTMQITNAMKWFLQLN